MNKRKRLVIYFHYDPRGKVEETCRLAVRAMRGASQAFFFVTNGCLDEESRNWITENADKILERENKGYDVGAYKEVLLSLGREALGVYDEVILMNYTLAGPVCDVMPMMDAMEEKSSLDFWGITRHYAMRSSRFKTEYGVVPEHIQSHFIAVRPRLFLSEVFWQYWREMSLPASYEQSVALHEARFTRFFEEQGFTWDTYIDTAELGKYFVNPIMACPKALIKEKKLPFFKRRSFFTPFEDELRRTDGCAAQELYLYLKRQTSYPVDTLISELLQTQPLTALCSNLHWNYLLLEKTTLEIHYLEAVDLEKPLHLDPDSLYCLLLPAMFTGTAGWYERQIAGRESIEKAASLFEENPRLGVIGPVLPMYHPCMTQKARLWKQNLPAIKALMTENGIMVSLDEKTPLPVPNGGYLLLRGSAFPQGLPSLSVTGDGAALWLLPLLAQQNGMYSATVEDACQCAARADICAVYETDKTIGQAAIELARTVKHTIQGNGENR